MERKLSNPMAYKVSTRIIFFLFSVFVAYILATRLYLRLEVYDFRFSGLNYWESVGMNLRSFLTFAFVYLFVQSVFALIKNEYMSASLFVGFSGACMINLVVSFLGNVWISLVFSLVLLVGELLAFIWYFKSAETILLD